MKATRNKAYDNMLGIAGVHRDHVRSDVAHVVRSGEWDLKVTGANDNLVGVGGTHYPTVSLGHICSQTFIP